MFLRSATALLMSSLYSATSGSCQSGSPVSTLTLEQPIGERLIVREEPGDLGAERHHAGTGQRRQVDDRVGLGVGGERERVGEDQPSLGVGVQHLDGLVVPESDDVARLLRLAARQVLGDRDEPVDVDRGLQAPERRHRA